MTTDQSESSGGSLLIMIGCLGLLTLFAVLAYGSRYVKALKRLSRHLEAGAFGSLYGAVSGFVILLALTLSARLTVEDEQVWVLPAFVGGGALMGDCLAVGIKCRSCKQIHHDGD